MTVYPRRLLSRKGFKQECQRIKILKDNMRSKQRGLRMTAQNFVARNIGLASDAVHLDGVTAQADFQDEIPHASHRMMVMQGGGATYCNVCARFSAGLQPLRKLLDECPYGIGAYAHQLRLLECGVIPVRGARIPPHARRVSAKRFAGFQ